MRFRGDNQTTRLGSATHEALDGVEVLNSESGSGESHGDKIQEASASKKRVEERGRRE